MRSIGIGAAILLLAAFSWWVRRMMAEPPPVPALIVSTTTRAVVDLLEPMPGTSLPGTPQRFLIAEIRDGAVVVGWGAMSDQHPAEVLRIAENAGRIVAWPSRAPARGVVVEAYTDHTAGPPLAHVEFPAPTAP